MQLNFKLINEITIALVFITGAAVIISSILAVSEIKKLSAARSAVQSASISIPLVSRRTDPYSQNEYKNLLQKINADNTVQVTGQSDKLVISTQSIKNESQWRQSVMEALALDKNLHVKHVCGGGNQVSICSGGALVAEIVGVHQVFFVNNNEGVSK